MKKIINKIVNILTDIPEDEYSTIIECAKKLASGQDLDTIIARVVDYNWEDEELNKILEENDLNLEKMAWTLLGAKLYKKDKHSIEEFMDLIRECNSTEPLKAKNNSNVNGKLTPTPDEKKKPNVVSPLF